MTLLACCAPCDREAWYTELEEHVLKLYSKLNGYSQQEARLSYLDYVKSWKIYGSSYYFAEPQNNKSFPPEVSEWSVRQGAGACGLPSFTSLF